MTYGMENYCYKEISPDKIDRTEKIYIKNGYTGGFPKKGKDLLEVEVLQSDKPVLLDFWASWCGPCQMVSPVIEQIGEENDSIRVGKVNVDEQGELTMQFRVVSIPTLVVMKGGEEVNRIVGAASKSEILAML